jgi:hypothetical protein
MLETEDPLLDGAIPCPQRGRTLDMLKAAYDQQDNNESANGIP